VPALIFDFDGLIVETEMVQFKALESVMADLGAVFDPADFLPLVGTHTPGWFERVVQLSVADDVDLDALNRRIRAVERPLTLAAPVMPGVAELLADARAAEWKVGLGSSSPRQWIDLHLGHRELHDRFDAIVTREDVERVKPQPDIYLELARRLGVVPAACVVLEDSEPGCRAAKAAGMVAVAVPTEMTRPSDFSCADRCLTTLDRVSLADLAQLIKN
jgi:HAD superfamily hydrolase (TIGR01509 family)